MNTELINRQKEIVEKLMKDQDPDNLYPYHDWRHVTNVIESVIVLSEDMGIVEESREDLVLAAVWHDADYANGKQNHESRSALLAAAALRKEKITEARITRIHDLILATQIGTSPKNDLEKIMRDADLSHFGSTKYYEFYDRLLIELNNSPKNDISKKKWKSECVKFMESHQFQTSAALERYDPGKLENLNNLKMKTDKDLPSNVQSNTDDLKKMGKKEKKRLKKDKPKYNAEKGIETMFRISLKNHITLSRIADDKANTLISVNAIILSIVLSALFPKLDSNPWLVYPGLALILTSISTIVLSTLSTIPRTTHGEVSTDDITNKKGNLLFFGNFHGMSLKEYEFGIKELMKDGEYLYGTLTRDLYFLGLVLNRKYGMLRWAYLTFVIGLVLSIILFVFSIANMNPQTALVETTNLI